MAFNPRMKSRASGAPSETIHPGVLPLHGDRSGVPDEVEHPEDVLPLGVPVPGGDEVPPAAGVGPGQVRGQDPVATVAHPQLRVLAVHVVDPVPELPQEADVVQALPHHVRRVVVEPEARTVADRVQRDRRAPVVVRDLAGVHLVGVPDADGVEDVDDRVPAVREVGVPGPDHVVTDRREHGQVVPDRGAGEADHGVDAERGRRPCGGLHLLGRALPHTLGVTVAPDPRFHHGTMAVVDDRVADRLAVQVGGDGPAAQPVRLQDVLLLLDVRVVLGGPGDVEVIAPARDLQAVVTPLRGESTDLLERQVGPLAGEQGHRAGLLRLRSAGGFPGRGGGLDGVGHTSPGGGLSGWWRLPPGTQSTSPSTEGSVALAARDRMKSRSESRFR